MMTALSASLANVNGRIAISAARNPETSLTNCVLNVIIKEDRVVAPSGPSQVRSAVRSDVSQNQYQVRTHCIICNLVVNLAGAL